MSDAGAGTRHITDVEALSRHLENLDTRERVRSAVLTCCRGMDRGDLSLILSAYHDDAVLRHGPFEGPASTFAAEWVRDRFPAFLSTSHRVANVLIHDGVDEAFVESYVLGYIVTRAAPDRVTVFSGRYCDDFAKRNGIWAIARRTSLHDWSGVMAFAPESAGVPGRPFVQGRRDRDDPSYEGVARLTTGRASR